MFVNIFKVTTVYHIIFCVEMVFILSELSGPQDDRVQ